MANYLYNGIELPALPAWDREKYPYACITEPAMQGTMFETSYIFRVCAMPFGCDGEYLRPTTEEKYPYMDCEYDEAKGKWGELSAGVIGEWGGNNSGQLPIWANHDIVYDDNYYDETLAGTVYLPARCPIDAETGEEYHGWCLHATAEPIGPTSFLQGWLVGRRLAGMRK